MTINLNFFQSNTTYFILIRYICTIMKKNHRHSAKMTAALIDLKIVLIHDKDENIYTLLHGCQTKASVFIWSLIPLFMNMGFQRWCISWGLLVVSLTTVRFSCGNSNSFWTCFDTHNNIFP